MGLSKEQQLAFNVRWMIQAREPLIQTAVEAAYAVFWSRNVKEVFANNSADEEGSPRPSSWSQLGTALGINPKHASRYGAEQDAKHGNLRDKLTIPETLLRYRASLVLGVPEEKLSPKSREWIAESARWLVTLSRPDLVIPLQTSQFHAFADYVLTGCDANQLCSTGLANAQKNASTLAANLDEIRDDILSVSQIVGDILANDVGLELKE